ncbi:MAG: hypothetical protein WKF61_10325 [Luteimonas sp.]
MRVLLGEKRLALVAELDHCAVEELDHCAVEELDQLRCLKAFACGE